MKNHFNYFLMMVLVSGFLFLTGCSEEETLPDGPSIVVTTTPEVDDNNTLTVLAGTSVSFDVDVTAPGGFNVMRVDLSVDGTSLTGYPKEYIRTTAGETIHDETFVISFSKDLVGSTVEIEFEAVDDNDKNLVQVIDVVVTSPTARTYTEILLNAPLGDRTSKTFFATADGVRYTANEVTNGAAGLSSTIDFGYYYLNAAGNSLSSPSDYPSTIYNLGPNGQGWSALNTTNFKTAQLTDEAYNAITTWADLDDVYANATNVGSVITGLTVGAKIAFMTDSDKVGGSKKGIIRVVEIVDGNSDGDNFDSTDGIKLEILVQEESN